MGTGSIVFLIILIAAMPKAAWIGVGVVVALIALIVFADKGSDAYAKRQERARVQATARAAAAEREREESVRRAHQQRVDTLGVQNAQLVESALVAVKQISASEAAREGWLGDVDFDPDVTRITETFEKAQALRKVAAELSALDKPGPYDRTILADANATAATLEETARARVGLIARCATEAQLIDTSLRDERRDAKTAEQRAELHAQLSALLYGIEASPDVAPTSSAAEAVMARVEAYRELKKQIHQARRSP